MLSLVNASFIAGMIEQFPENKKMDLSFTIPELLFFLY